MTLLIGVAQAVSFVAFCCICASDIHTKDKDHARDEEFHSHRPSHLEQYASHSVKRNSLPSDVRSTSDGPPVWLIDSASEDYL